MVTSFPFPFFQQSGQLAIPYTSCFTVFKLKASKYEPCVAMISKIEKEQSCVLGHKERRNIKVIIYKDQSYGITRIASKVIKKMEIICFPFSTHFDKGIGHLLVAQFDLTVPLLNAIWIKTQKMLKKEAYLVKKGLKPFC